MSRDGQGNYTPPYNDVATGDVISSTWANGTIDDIASAITDSLSRSGNGGMLAAFRAVDGTVNIPAISFNNETNSGIYRAGTGEYRLCVNGKDKARIKDVDGMAAFQVFDLNGTDAWETLATASDLSSITLADALAAGNTTGGTNIAVDDDDRIVFGASTDLSIYHTSGFNYILAGNATPSLNIGAKSGGEISLMYAGGTEVVVDGVGLRTNGGVISSEPAYDVKVQAAVGYGVNLTSSGGLSRVSATETQAQLFYGASAAAGAKKLETTSTGIDVTGDVAATTVTVGDSTGTNLELYEDSSQNAIIRQRGTGSLQISGINGSLSNDDYEQLLTWGSDAIHLSWQGTTGAGTKLSTTETGIDVTGTVEADGFSGTGTVTITDFIDDDSFATASAANVPTAESVKSYVDAQVGGQDTLAEILAVGNTTGGTDLSVSAADDLLLTDSSKIIASNGLTGADKRELQIYVDGTANGISKIIAQGQYLGISAENHVQLGGSSGFPIVKATVDTASLYHGNGAVDNEVKLATTATGIDVTGTVTADGVSLGNNEKITFGGESDGKLEIYESTGGNAFIEQTGNGNLSIKGQDITLSNNADQTLIKTILNTAQLYHRNGDNEGLKLETTNGGIDVTGTAETNGILISDDTAGDDTKPELKFYKDVNSTTGDFIGEAVFEAKDHYGDDRVFAEIRAQAKEVPTNTVSRPKGAIHFNIADGTSSGDLLEKPSCVIDATGVRINSENFDGTTRANYYHVDNINLVTGTQSGGLKFNSHTEDNASNKTTQILSKDITEDHEISIPSVSGTLVVAAIAGGSINGGGGTTSPKSTWSETNFTANTNTTYLHYNPLNTTDLTVSPEYPDDGFGEFFKFLNASPQSSEIVIDLDGYSGSSVASYALTKTDGSLNVTITTSSYSTITVSSGGFVTLTKVSLGVYLVEGIGYTYS